MTIVTWEPWLMAEPVKFQVMLGKVRQGFEQVPDFRPGQNTRYELVDAGLSAFSVFHVREPSFLAYQQHMQEREGRNNPNCTIYEREKGPSYAHLESLPFLLTAGAKGARPMDFTQGELYMLLNLTDKPPWLHGAELHKTDLTLADLSGAYLITADLSCWTGPRCAPVGR